MVTQQNNTECVITCWGIAAFVGLVAMVMFYWMAGLGPIQAIFCGGLLGTVLGLVLSLTICRPQTAAADLAAEEKPATRYAAEAADRKAARIAATLGPDAGTAGVVAGSAGGAPGSAGQGAGTAGAAPGSAGAAPGSAGAATGVSASTTSPASSVGGPEAGTVPAGMQDTTAPTGNMAAVTATPVAASTVVPSKALAGQQELAGRKGDWKYEGDPKPAVKAAPTAKAPAKAAAAAPIGAGVPAQGTKPELLSTARPEGKDDLKKISGVGPKLEETLNSMGIYHFDQIAKWRKKEIIWVDSNLRFKGRIERDDWMAQAKILAKGGETEFSKKKKK